MEKVAFLIQNGYTFRMTTNPHTLPVDFLECPADCPFLGMRTFMPNTLPFYCNQYETFLGANPGQKILRCANCRGVVRDNVAAGLAFIESYIGVPAVETREAFLRLDHSFQKMFVDLISKTGVQIILSTGESDKPANLADDILKKWKEAQDRAGSPEMQEFAGILDAEGMPLMSRQTKTLLMNLFQVLDNSEKDMIKNVLQNPKQIDSFLEQFDRQPQDNDLLKNVRSLIYDYDRQRQEMEREQQRQREELRQREALALFMQRRNNERGFSR